MTGREFRAALRGGRRVYGTCVTSPNPMFPGILRGACMDFVFIDTEHIALDRETVAGMCGTYAGMGIVPVVRIPSPDPFAACAMADAGARGIITPYIESPDDVRALVGATKLRPIKGERLARALREPDSLEPELATYLEERNADMTLIVNIESVPAIERLDEIVAVPGLDALLIGPHDLTCSLGIPEQYEHPRFDEAVREIISKGRAAGLGAGLHFFWDDVDAEVRWVKNGGNLVLYSNDGALFAQALNAGMAAIRGGVGAAARDGSVLV